MNEMPNAVQVLYQDAQINEDMDCGTYCGGTDVYNVTTVIREIASRMDWRVPDSLTFEDMRCILINQGRGGEVEYLMSNPENRS